MLRPQTKLKRGKMKRLPCCFRVEFKNFLKAVRWLSAGVCDILRRCEHLKTVPIVLVMGSSTSHQSFWVYFVL